MSELYLDSIHPDDDINDEEYFNDIINPIVRIKGEEGIVDYYCLRTITNKLLFRWIRELSNNDGIYLKKCIVLKKHDMAEITRIIKEIVDKTKGLSEEKAFSLLEEYFNREDIEAC